MRWSEAAICVCLLTALSNTPFPLERAAQFAVLGVVLDVTQTHWLRSIVQAPLAWFVATGLIFEILHLLHKRRTKAMRNTWKHLEKLRGQKDLSTLLTLLLDAKAQVLGPQLIE